MRTWASGQRAAARWLRPRSPTASRIAPGRDRTGPPGPPRLPAEHGRGVERMIRSTSGAAQASRNSGPAQRCTVGRCSAAAPAHPAPAISLDLFRHGGEQIGLVAELVDSAASHRRPGRSLSAPTSSPQNARANNSSAAPPAAAGPPRSADRARSWSSTGRTLAIRNPSVCTRTRTSIPSGRHRVKAPEDDMRRTAAVRGKHAVLRHRSRRGGGWCPAG